MNRYAMAALYLMLIAFARMSRLTCRQRSLVLAANVRSRVISAVSIRIKTIPKAQWSGRMACCCSASVMNAPSVQTRWSGVA